MSKQLSVRVPGLGTWLLSHSVLSELNRFDTEIETAVADGDGVRARKFLEDLVAHVTEYGERSELGDRVDVVLPSSAATLSELEVWLAVTPLEDGLLPD